MSIAKCKRPHHTGCECRSGPLTANVVLSAYLYSNSWVALAHQLQNDTLLGYTESFLNHILASRHPSGDFGPGPFNTSLPTLLWPRYLIMLGLIVSCRPLSACMGYLALHMRWSNTLRQIPVERSEFATSCTRLSHMQRSASRLATLATKHSVDSTDSRSSVGKR